MPTARQCRRRRTQGHQSRLDSPQRDISLYASGR